jgi:hypothetical protein
MGSTPMLFKKQGMTHYHLCNNILALSPYISYVMILPLITSIANLTNKYFKLYCSQIKKSSFSS